MNKPRSSVLRVLGVLVGVAFVATAPFIASDKGLPSFDGVAYLLVSVALGFVFIAYGIVRPARFPNLPLSRPYPGGFARVLLSGFWLNTPAGTRPDRD